MLTAALNRSSAATDAGREVLSPVLQIPELEPLALCRAASWHTSLQVVQNRRWQRVRYGRTVLLVPLDGDQRRPHRVAGRDISLGGFSFSHPRLLSCREAAVTFPLAGGESLTMQLRLTWCRFTRAGLYHSGGLFVRQLAAAVQGAAVAE